MSVAPKLVGSRGELPGDQLDDEESMGLVGHRAGGSVGRATAAQAETSINIAGGTQCIVLGLIVLSICIGFFGFLSGRLSVVEDASEADAVLKLRDRVSGMETKLEAMQASFAVESTAHGSDKVAFSTLLGRTAALESRTNPNDLFTKLEAQLAKVETTLAASAGKGEETHDANLNAIKQLAARLRDMESFGSLTSQSAIKALKALESKVDALKEHVDEMNVVHAAVSDVSRPEPGQKADEQSKPFPIAPSEPSGGTRSIPDSALRSSSKIFSSDLSADACVRGASFEEAFKNQQKRVTQVFSTYDCVNQSLAEVCGDVHGKDQTVCVPIEPLEDVEWRLKLDGMYSKIEQRVLYRKSVINPDFSGFRKRLYIDLGANRYDTSINGFFNKRYHDGGDISKLRLSEPFHIVAFEGSKEFIKSYADRKDVEFYRMIVHTENTTLVFSGSHASKAPPGAHDGTPALDIADFLRRRAEVEDYVVVKMDIEGSEYDVLRHLLKEKVTNLIDEMFVEFHTEVNTCCRPPNDVGRHREDAVKLIQTLRAAGVYVHEWA